MTNEQIKQNAEAYAKQFLEPYDEEYAPIKYVTAQMAHIAGAHSRDEEIKDLSVAATGLAKENKELKIKLAELRNQWISVKYKLPDKAWDNRMGHLTEDSNIVLAVSSSGKLFSNLYYSYHLHEWLEKGAGLNGVDRVLQYHKITHWMPIPKTPKGGEV